MTRGSAGGLSLAFCGDIMLGAEVGEHIGKASLANWLSEVSPAWRGADALIGNLESPCVDIARAVPKSQPELMFRSPAFRARELAEAGFSAVTLANNHILDCGPEGLRETLQALDEAGIQHTGAGMSLEEALRPALLRLGGRTLGIVAFSYAPAATARGPGAASSERKTMERGLSRARSSCDILVAALHDGLEYSDVPPTRTRERLRFLAEHGADIVVGHHPHVLQGIEWKGDIPIACSLGDLLFHNSLPLVATRNFGRMALTAHAPGEVQRDPEKFSRGAVLTIGVSETGKSVKWHPFRQDSELRPRLCSGEALAEDLRRLAALSAALDDTKDSRLALADRVMEACFRENRAALGWQEVFRLGRRPKWRYVPLGFSWLVGRLRKTMLGA